MPVLAQSKMSKGFELISILPHRTCARYCMVIKLSPVPLQGTNSSLKQHMYSA